MTHRPWTDRHKFWRVALMDVPQLFGMNMRRLRLEKGLSQEEFGFVAGIDRTYVSGVERGLRNPTIVLAEKFAHGLGVELHELLQPVTG